MKRIFITGASAGSATGRMIAKRLHRDYELFNPARTELELENSDAVAAYVHRVKPDVIVHCATGTMRSELSRFESSLRMFSNLLTLSDSVERLIWLGSGAEYDKTRDIINIDESAFGDVIPKDSYGLGKYLQTLLARPYGNFINLRVFGMINPAEDYTRNFLSNLCAKAALDIPLTIRQECTFSFLDVRDLAEMVRWAIEGSPKHKEYNACVGRYLLSELAETVLRVSCKKLPITVLRNGRALEYTGNSSRIQTESGISCTPIEESLYVLYSTIKENSTVYDRMEVEHSK
jgi:GDP-L-fucose synthase